MTFYNTLRIIVWPQEFVEVAKVLQEKFSKCFLESKINFYSWEKKTKIKVHLQNFWSQKGSVKQKCSSWNFGISIHLWNLFLKVWKGFFFKKELVILPCNDPARDCSKVSRYREWMTHWLKSHDTIVRFLILTASEWMSQSTDDMGTVGTLI